MSSLPQAQEYQLRIPANNIAGVHMALQALPSNVNIFDCMIGNCNGHQILCLSVAVCPPGYSCVPLKNAHNNVADLLELGFLFEQLIESFDEGDVIDSIVSVPQGLNNTYIAVGIDHGYLASLDSIPMCRIGRSGADRLLPLLHLSIPSNGMRQHLDALKNMFNGARAQTFSAVSCGSFLQMDIVPFIGNWDAYRYNQGLPNGWDAIVANVENAGLGRLETVALACGANQQRYLDEIKDLVKALHDQRIEITTLMPIPRVPPRQLFKYTSQ